MKRLALSLILVTMSVLASFGRGIMTFNEAQQQAYFLTDKMAYELDLTPAQYDQVYQVNLEYFLNVSGSDPWGYYWNYRNTDLAYILFDWQYGLYARAEYFYRPITWRRGVWYLPVWDYYKRTHFYYSHPSIWNTWRGGLWTGRVHSTPSPFIGHRPSAHHGGMRHDPYPGGHPNHNGGVHNGHNGHIGGQPGYNGGGHNGHNGHNGGQPGYNGGGNNNRPNGGQPGYNGGGNNNNRPNGGGQPGFNGGGNNRPNGGGQVGGGNHGGNNRPNRGGGQAGANRGGENRGGGHAGGTRNFGGGHR